MLRAVRSWNAHVGCVGRRRAGRTVDEPAEVSRAGGGARSCPEHRRRIRRPCGPGRCRPRWRCEGDRGSRCRRPRRPRRTAVVRRSGGRSVSPATCRRCTGELDEVDGARAGPARRDGQPRGRASHDHGRRRRSRPTTAWLEALDDYGEALRLQGPMAALFQERGRRGAPAETGRALKARGIRPGWERTARGHQWRSGAVRGRGWVSGRYARMLPLSGPCPRGDPPNTVVNSADDPVADSAGCLDGIF